MNLLRGKQAISVTELPGAGLRRPWLGRPEQHVELAATSLWELWRYRAYVRMLPEWVLVYVLVRVPPLWFGLAVRFFGGYVDEIRGGRRRWRDADAEATPEPAGGWSRAPVLRLCDLPMVFGVRGWYVRERARGWRWRRWTWASVAMWAAVAAAWIVFAVMFFAGCAGGAAPSSKCDGPAESRAGHVACLSVDAGGSP